MSLCFSEARSRVAQHTQPRPRPEVQAASGVNCVAKMCKAMCAPKSCAINGFVGAVLCFGLLIFTITEKRLGSTMIKDLFLFLVLLFCLACCGPKRQWISRHITRSGLLFFFFECPRPPVGSATLRWIGPWNANPRQRLAPDCRESVPPHHWLKLLDWHQEMPRLASTST